MGDNKNNPIVSIILATHNGERFLKEQLDSVFQQTYSNLQIIAVDDCSSDNTVSILHQYELLHGNLRVYVNDKNIGHIKAFEKGITLSTGDYIALCDQDDIWEKEKIELLMEKIIDYQMVFCNSAFIDDEGKSLQKTISDIKNVSSYTNCIPFIIENCISGHAALFKREIAVAAIPFPENIIHDWWLAFVASTKGTVYFVNKPLVKYRQHKSNFIGAIKVEGRLKKIQNQHEKLNKIKNRVRHFYEICPESNFEAKEILRKLNKSYESFSIKNNFLRMFTYHKYKSDLLAIKKRTAFRKWLFCFKMFVKIR